MFRALAKQCGPGCQVGGLQKAFKKCERCLRGESANVGIADLDYGLKKGI